MGGPEGPPYRSSPPYTSTLSIQARSRLVRLLFATSQSYLPQRVGGSQRSTHELSVGLAARGNEVAVLCELDRPLDWTNIQNRTVATVTRRSHPCDRWRPYRIYRGYDVSRGAREVARAFRPDVAIVHAGIAMPLVSAFLAHEIRTVVYFRDVQFGAIGGAIPRTTRLRFLATCGFVGRTGYFVGIRPAQRRWRRSWASASRQLWSLIRRTVLSSIRSGATAPA